MLQNLRYIFFWGEVDKGKLNYVKFVEIFKFVWIAGNRISPQTFCVKVKAASH